MLSKLKSTKEQKGFTIIEVMIVLAIAGLILLIIFLAIPALQRNSRNTQRKQEAGTLGAAYSEFVNNHGGANPANASDVYGNAKLTFYNTGNIKFESLSSGTTALSKAPADTDSVDIIVNAKCDPTITFSSTVNSSSQVQYSSRGGVILYMTEGGSQNTTTCISAG